MQKTNKNAIRKDIAALIDGIKASSDRIGFRKDISQAELDVIIHQIEQLYRKSVVFAYLNTLPEEEDAVIVPIPQPVVQQEVKVTPVAPVVPEVVPPVVTIPEEHVIVPEPVVPIVEEQVPVLEPEPSLQPVNKDPDPVVQETPAVQEEQKSVAPASSRPDFKKAIGLNERIMFTRLLFKQDQSAYEECIAQLSACASRDEALAFLDMLSGTYKWNKQSDEVQTLYTIVKNRF
jgi:hypothetical protein